MNLKKVSLLCATLFISTVTFSQKSFTLEEAIKYGLENNPQAKISAMDVEIAKKKVKETASMGLPQLSGEVKYQNFIDIPTQVVPGEAFGAPVEFVEVQFGVEQNAGLSFTASQLIFNGNYLVGLKASQVYVKMAEYQQGLSTTNLRSDIKNAYQLVVLSKENLEVIKDSHKKVEQAYNETVELNKAGFIDEASVDELELSKLNLENAIINAENQIKTSKLLLKLYLGIPANEEVSVTNTLDNLMSKTVQIADFNVTNNIQYGMLETKEQLQTLNLRNEQAKWMPTLSAYYNHQKNAYANEFSFLDSDQTYYPTNLVGVTISVPIFDGGGRIFKTGQAKIEVEKVQEEKKQLETGLQLQYQQAVADLSNAEKTLDLVNKKISLGEGILDKAYANHKEGLISSFELNQKESQFLQLKGEYLQASMAVLNAKLEIEKLQSSK